MQEHSDYFYIMQYLLHENENNKYINDQQVCYFYKQIIQHDQIDYKIQNLINHHIQTEAVSVNEVNFRLKMINYLLNVINDCFQKYLTQKNQYEIIVNKLDLLENLLKSISPKIFNHETNQSLFQFWGYITMFKIENINSLNKIAIITQIQNQNYVLQNIDLQIPQYIKKKNLKYKTKIQEYLIIKNIQKFRMPIAVTDKMFFQYMFEILSLDSPLKQNIVHLCIQHSAEYFKQLTEINETTITNFIYLLYSMASIELNIQVLAEQFIQIFLEKFPNLIQQVEIQIAFKNLFNILNNLIISDYKVNSKIEENFNIQFATLRWQQLRSLLILIQLYCKTIINMYIISKMHYYMLIQIPNSNCFGMQVIKFYYNRVQIIQFNEKANSKDEIFKYQKMILNQIEVICKISNFLGKKQYQVYFDQIVLNLNNFIVENQIDVINIAQNNNNIDQNIISNLNNICYHMYCIQLYMEQVDISKVMNNLVVEVQTIIMNNSIDQSQKFNILQIYKQHFLKQIIQITQNLVISNDNDIQQMIELVIKFKNKKILQCILKLNQVYKALNVFQLIQNILIKNCNQDRQQFIFKENILQHNCLKFNFKLQLVVLKYLRENLRNFLLINKQNQINKIISQFLILKKPYKLPIRNFILIIDLVIQNFNMNNLDIVSLDEIISFSIKFFVKKHNETFKFNKLQKLINRIIEICEVLENIRKDLDEDEVQFTQISYKQMVLKQQILIIFCGELAQKLKLQQYFKLEHIKNNYQFSQLKIKNKELYAILSYLSQINQNLFLNMYNIVKFTQKNKTNFFKFIKQIIYDNKFLSNSQFFDLYLEHIQENNLELDCNIFIENRDYKVYQMFNQIEQYQFIKQFQNLPIKTWIFYMPQLFVNINLKYIQKLLIQLSQQDFEFMCYLIWLCEVEIKFNTKNEYAIKFFQKIIRKQSKNWKYYFNKIDTFYKDICNISSKVNLNQSKEKKHEQANQFLDNIQKLDFQVFLVSNSDKAIKEIIYNSAKAMNSAAKCPILIQFEINNFNGFSQYKLQNNQQLQMSEISYGTSMNLIIPKQSIFLDQQSNQILSQKFEEINIQNQNQNENIKLIVKVFDDIRQDTLALQVMEYLQSVFVKENLPLKLITYKTFSLNVYGNIGGIIEVCPNSESFDSIFKNNQMNLYEYFILQFGQENSLKYQEAQKNFINSLAACSLACYFLHIKDRHNGNILLDDKGHIIHIDFGFILGISPSKNLGFERAAFKLTQDMIKIIGGNRKSDIYKYYQDLCIQGYLACRKNWKDIYCLISQLSQSNLPCFLKHSLELLKKKFRLDLDDFDAAKHMRDIINYSYDHWTTNVYDFIQYKQNNYYY